MQAQGIFTVSKWNETPLEQESGAARLARASIAFDVTGGISGTCAVEYILHYAHMDPADPHKSEATYLGFLVFEGEMDGKRGSFVMEDHGSYTATGPASTLVIKSGTGTDGFTGIAGSGTYALQDGQMVMELDYHL